MGQQEETQSVSMSQFLTPSQAMKYCNIKKTTFYKWVKAGLIKNHTKKGRIVRYNIHDLQKCMNA